MTAPLLFGPLCTYLHIPPAAVAADEPYSPTFTFRNELGRKALHLLALVVPMGIWWLGRATSLTILVPCCIVAVVGDVLRVRSAGFRTFIHRVFGSLMRPEEVPPLGGPIYVNGATWVLLSATLLVALFPVDLAVPAFVMFMIADAAAALVGSRLGRIYWPGSRRTVEGSLAFVVTGFLVLIAFPDVAYAAALACALIGASAEALPRPLNDNMRVPLVVATLLWAFEQLLR